MENTLISSRRKQPFPVLAFIFLVFIILFGVFVYQTWIDNNIFYKTEKPFITQGELEEQYGLQVRLIGVTAGGGFVDFRLKVVDPDKARSLLEDPKSKPGLWIEETGTHLMVTEEITQELKFEEGGIIFIMLPNSGGIVQPGTPVNVVFGNLFVEPIPAQ